MNIGDAVKAMTLPEQAMLQKSLPKGLGYIDHEVVKASDGD